MKVTDRHPIRTMIVAPGTLQRDLLKLAFDELSRTELVGVHNYGAEAMRAAQSLDPEVIVLDVDPEHPASGIQMALKLRSVVPDVGVVLLVDHRTGPLLTTVPDNRLLGWVYPIDRSSSNLKALGRAVHITAAKLLELERERTERGSSHSGRGLYRKLTDRQLEVLALLAQGRSNASIAEALQITEKTVENQLTAIYHRLDIHRNGGAHHPRIRAALAYLDGQRTRESGIVRREG